MTTFTYMIRCNGQAETHRYTESEANEVFGEKNVVAMKQGHVIKYSNRHWANLRAVCLEAQGLLRLELPLSATILS